MAKSRSSRGRSRRTTNVARPAQPVMMLTPSEAFERTLGQSNDSTVLRGKLLISANLSAATPVVLLNVLPGNLGIRASTLAGVFSRYRIKGMLVKFTSTIGAGTNNTGTLGFLDDLGSEGIAPTSVGGVLELRCSASNFTNEDRPTYVTYTPVDKTKWYYTSATSSGADGRLIFPATIYVANSGAGNVIAEIDYTIVFAGSADGGSS